ncbi:DeoR/GlpR family DNA-binding transcription regulator [Halalkalibacterium ligniniphilum]|uniref:DeoR/GlpR family DNA-binding transcription regulator n=1 Tax=Halalkalibacterium ligniniphilum TaxID=1134413 RepID=UPI0004768CE2|nr:DeoR/GlpR family DNA-binding transcription regulator [Halalkalibacterium ligniniphilum]
MLTVERQELILSMVKARKVVTIHELVEETGASESTIRRDLTELESANKLKRIHGGASALQRRSEEPTVAEKTVKNNYEKQLIAKQAADILEEGDCIFLDAGTTTFEMIPFLTNKKVVVVTNGLDSLSALIEHDIETYVLGGAVKRGTRAFVGRHAVQMLQTFRFDKAFIGTNGIGLEDGFTTPDPQEAFVKETAISLARESFVLADHTKFGETAFSHFASLDKATIITSAETDQSHLEKYKQRTTVKVVTA